MKQEYYEFSWQITFELTISHTQTDGTTVDIQLFLKLQILTNQVQTSYMMTKHVEIPGNSQNPIINKENVIDILNILTQPNKTVLVC